jgi:hypothetical protein
MTHLLSIKSLATLSVALAALAASASANASGNVYFSVGVHSPGFYLEAAPIYVQPAPIYYQPLPIYQPRIIEGHRHDQRPQWSQGNYVDHNRFGAINIRESNYRNNAWRQAERFGPYGDIDRDGIKNRFDQDRDGDGIRNRFDRLPNSPYRR